MSGWLGPPINLQINHAAANLPANLFSYQEEVAGRVGNDRLAEGDEYLAGGSGGLQGETGWEYQPLEANQHLPGGSEGLEGGTGWDRSVESDGYLAGGSGKLQSGDGWGNRSLKANQRLPGGSGEFEGETGWKDRSAEGDEYLEASSQRLPQAGGSDGPQGGTGWGDRLAEGSGYLAGGGGRAGWEDRSLEASQPLPGGSGRPQGGPQAGTEWEDLLFEEWLANEHRKGGMGWHVGSTNSDALGAPANDEMPDLGGLGEEDDFEGFGDEGGFDEAGPAAPHVGPREPPIAVRNNADYDPARFVKYIISLYRRMIIEPDGDLNKLIGPLNQIKVLVKVLYMISFNELRNDPNVSTQLVCAIEVYFGSMQIYDTETREWIEQAAAKGILRRISQMKEYAVFVAYGPEGERGGYGLTDTPEGAQKARDLLADDRYLYHVRLFYQLA